MSGGQSWREAGSPPSWRGLRDLRASYREYLESLGAATPAALADLADARTLSDLGDALQRHSPWERDEDGRVIFPRRRRADR